MSGTLENSLSVILTNALAAAVRINVAHAVTPHVQCRRELMGALHSVLIVAEECRQRFAAASAGQPIPSPMAETSGDR